MAATYGYADGGGPMPDELILLGYIDRFGAQAVLGRALSAGEIKSMVLAENVKNAYQERQNSQDWAVWKRDNDAKANLLNEAMELWQKQA
jgi:hypothetical protein